MIETQLTVCAWADDTFGPCTPQVAVDRMLEEIDELRALEGDPTVCEATRRIRDECSDVVIAMYRVAETLGFDLHKAIYSKMSLNRERKWQVSSAGVGYHI